MLLANSNTTTAQIYPQSQTLFEQAQHYLPGGNSRHSVFFQPHPIYAHSGKGCRVTDMDGDERIDCINNMSALIHGHAFAPVTEAVKRQIDRLMSAGMPTELEIELAQLLCSRVPSLEQIRFCTSGSEAIMIAVRAARAYTGRNLIAKAEGAYHGSYDAVEFSLVAHPELAGGSDAPHSVPATPGLPDGCAEQTIVFPFNDLDATLNLIERHKDSLAAVIVDPCVSRMGFVLGKLDYLHAIRDYCSRYGILLIYDEIFSFRIHPQGAQTFVGVKPDLTTFGKVIGGGLPIGAIGGQKQFMAVFDQLHAKSVVEHSGTHFANPLSLTAGLETLRALDAVCAAHLDGLGDALRAGINDSFRRHKLPGYAAGVASLVCAVQSETEITDCRTFTKAMMSGGARFGQLIHRAMLDRGAHIVPGGGFILSSAMTQADIQELVGMFDDAIEQIASS
jgi:glutamate-1-semialdehyde 2,1-aminomutase